jgi:hypothetical protein
LESHKLPRKNLRKTQVSLRKVAQLPKPLNQFLPKVAWLFYICSCTAVPEETAEPIVDLLNRGVSVVGIAARKNLTANGVARKWRRKGLKRLNPRPEMVWSRKPRTHKMWYTGARLAVRASG